MHADFSVELGGNDPALELPWSSDDPSVRYYDLKGCPELVLQIPEAVAYPKLSEFLIRINAPEFPLETAKCDAWYSQDISPEEEIFGADRKFVSYIDLVFVHEDARCSFAKHERIVKELCRLLSHAPDIAGTVEFVIRRCYFHQPSIHQPSFVRQDEAAQVSGPLRRDTRNHKTTPSEQEEFNSDDRERSNARRLDARGEHAEAPRPSDREHTEGTRSLDNPNANGSGFCLTAYVTGFGDSDHEPLHRWEIALALLQHALVQLNHLDA
jgi:hypothetical protein